MDRQSEKLDNEISDLIAKVEAACNAYMSARNPLQKAQLEKCCKVLKKNMEIFRSSYACRMDAVREQLQKLNNEIDDLAGKAEATWTAYMSATNPQQKAELKERHEKLEKKEELLNARRVKLEDKLPSSGEHIVQAASAEAALAAVGTSAQNKLSDSGLEHHRPCCCPESAVSANTYPSTAVFLLSSTPALHSQSLSEFFRLQELRRKPRYLKVGTGVDCSFFVP